MSTSVDVHDTWWSVARRLVTIRGFEDQFVFFCVILPEQLPRQMPKLVAVLVFHSYRRPWMEMAQKVLPLTSNWQTSPPEQTGHLVLRQPFLDAPGSRLMKIRCILGLFPQNPAAWRGDGHCLVMDASMRMTGVNEHYWDQPKPKPSYKAKKWGKLMYYDVPLSADFKGIR
jgi:hypothetical protein